MNKWCHWRRLLQLIGLPLFIWVLSRIDFSAMVRQMTQANWFFVFLSVALGLPFIWLKSERWRMILQWTGSNLSLGIAFRLFSIGLLAGLATPGQLGEFAKALDIRRHGGTLRSGLTASVGDRALDIAMLIGLGAYYMLYYYASWPALRSLAIFLVVMVLVMLIAAGLWLVMAKVLVSFSSRLRLSEKALRSVVIDFSWSRTIMLAIYTLLAYTLYSLRLYLLLLALGQSVPIVPFISSMAVMSLITLLPISIAGIGSRDAALLVLFGQFNISQEAAIGFSLLVLLITHLFNAIVGTIAWGFHFSEKFSEKSPYET